MKRLSLLALLFPVLLAGTHTRAESPVQQLLTQAQTEFRKGDLASAKRDFETVQQLDPHNLTAINFLRQITAMGGKNGLTSLPRGQIEGVIVPKVEFKEATLDSVLEALKKNVAKLTDNKVMLNFVAQIPDEQLHTQTVTLSLTNVPFTEVLRYLGTVANVRFTFDKYAIIVKPLAPANAAPATGTGPASGSVSATETK